MNKMLVVLVALFLVACSRVEPGYVGVKVNLLGGDKGVDVEELGTGKYWIGWNEQLYTFPVFSQSMVWTKDKTEGSPNDDSMSFQTKEGLSVNTDLGITYAIDPKKVSVIFQKYRKGIDEITSVYLRSMVRDALVTEASSRPIESVYGEGKAELIKAVQARVIEQTLPIGIIVEKIYLVGDLRLPTVVTEAINAKIGATQKASQRENEVAQSKAEADKAVAEAKGVADSALIIAESTAKAIEVKGKALEQYPKVLELTKIERWDGAVTKVTGVGNALLQVDVK
jgi:regulator of protease activity HflC (stomatin/prohibitin superfamily)